MTTMTVLMGAKVEAVMNELQGMGFEFDPDILDIAADALQRTADGNNTAREIAAEIAARLRA